MPRVSVISQDGQPLMPTKPSRARRWLKEGKAVGKFNDLDIFYVQLTGEPSDTKTQPMAIGIDPGKLFSGIGVQLLLSPSSSDLPLAVVNYTLWFLPRVVSDVNMVVPLRDMVSVREI